MDAFIGTILAVGFNFPPRGWAFCNGQLMSIAQNSALFALLGTMYGGDGVSTFGLPDLRGRTVVGSQAAGPGLTPIQQGELAGTNNVTVIANGTASVTITAANLPAHTHTATMTGALTVGTNTTGGTQVPTEGASLAGTAGGPAGAAIYLPSSTPPTGPVNLTGVTGAVTVAPNTSSGQATAVPVTTQALISVMQPFTGLNYIIATEGIFPSRN